MSDESLRALIREDPDFINARRFSNSIKRLEERYPDGCPSNVIAKVLMMTEEELEAENVRIVAKLRELMGVDETPP